MAGKFKWAMRKRRRGTCLTCKREGKFWFRRGCCERCYRYHNYRVSRARMTWEDLVSRGLALPRSK